MLDTQPADHAVSTGEPGFTIAVRPDNSHVTLSLSGDLDLETAGQLREEIDSLRDAGFDDIAVDLGGVTFLDSTGLQTLLAYAHTVELHFQLTRLSVPVQRLFELTATRETFEVMDRSSA